MSRARELAKAGGVQQRIAGFSSHVGMSTFLAEVHMEDNLTVDGNIGVGGNLTVTGTTTFNGGTLNLGNAATDNVVFGGEVDSNIIPDDDGSFDLGSSSKEWKDLFIDGTAHIDTLDVDENAGIIGNLTVTGNSVMNGNVDLGDATGDTITATGRFDSDLVPSTDGARDLGSSTLEWQDLFIDGTATIDTLQVDENATITGSLTANGDVDLGNATSDTITATGRFDSDLVPSTDGARDLGDASLEWKDLYVDGVAYLDSVESDGGSFGNIQIAETGDNEIDTESGNLTLDSAGGTVAVDDNLTVSGNGSVTGTFDVDGATTLDGLTVAEGATFQSTIGVTGAATFNGNVDLGNATSDTITATGRFDSGLVPSTDGARDIGASTLEWKDLFIDGTAHIDTLDVDENAAIIGTLDVNSSKLTVGTGNTDVIVRGDMRVTGIMSVGNGTVTIDETTIKTGTSNLHNVGIEVAGINVLGADTPIGDNATIFNNGNATFAGTVTAASLDISGSIDIDGTTNLDAVDIDGAVDMASSLTLAGNADFNGNLDVDGTSNLDAVDIDGAVDMASTLTLAGNADFNGDLDVDGTSNLDAVDIDGAVDMASSLTLAGNADFNGNLDVDGTTDLDTTNVVGTLTVTGDIAADNVTINGNTVSTSSGNLTIDSSGGTTTIADNAIISGNLTVNGTTTTINSTTVAIDDKNFQVATGAADDAAANGAGFTIDSGDGDKTFNFEATGDNWGASENLNLASGKVYKINNTSVLSATTLGSGVVSSSLTSVGTLGSLAVTNNITVGGTVDGRDVAGDGSKLDGIESGATADQTAAEIRTLVESASDSNVFTDADHSKLNGIEASATADQTAAEIRTLVESASDSNVFTDADHSKLNGIEASATADQSASEILTLIKTVDGAGSGLDADTLDGISSASFLRSDTSDTFTGTLTVSGNILPNANGTRDLGASGTRWANIYSSDLDLSNQAKGANSVDGTWGSYLIEEGEDHLFLTNRRSGKKYRFVLEEV